MKFKGTFQPQAKPYPTTTPVLTVNVGTAANTVAAGDDSRITGAAQKSANLSDLASALTARGNLGLGTSSTLNVAAAGTAPLKLTSGPVLTTPGNLDTVSNINNSGGNITLNSAASIQAATPMLSPIIYGGTGVGGGSATINWNKGNSISTDYNCASNLVMDNLRDGGTYSLAVTSTATTQCTFSTTTTGLGAATVSYRYKPANAARTASSHTVYTLMR